MASVLYIEDNRQNSILAYKILERKGYEFLHANTGTKGLEIAQDAIPDIILLDIKLPDIDGRDVCQQLKADDTTADIPVIAVTGHIMHGDREAILSAGFDEYLPKPITGFMLLNTIDRLLGR